ncbi:MAG: ankyrin repeat domain-containing protein [Wolbachia sp.]
MNVVTSCFSMQQSIDSGTSADRKVSINVRVKDGSNDGPTALHIAALYGYKDIVELLLSDNRIDPSLKSKIRL